MLYLKLNEKRFDLSPGELMNTLAQGLFHDTKITAIRLAYNFKSKREWEEMCSLLCAQPHLNRIHLVSRSGYTNVLDLKGCVHLQDLFFRLRGAIETDQIAALLETAPNLQRLGLDGYEVPASILAIDKLYEGIRKSNITVIHLADWVTTPAQLHRLPERIETLECIRCINMSLPSLCHTNALHTLILHHCGITEEDAVTLSSKLYTGLPLLKNLLMGENPKVRDAGLAVLFDAVRRHGKIEELDVSNCGRSCVSPALNQLIRGDTLKRLNMYTYMRCPSYELRALVTALGFNRNLRALGVNITNTFIDQLLEVNGTITELRIFGLDCSRFNQRNIGMHEAARASIYAFLTYCKKKDNILGLLLHKDLVLPIARLMWKSRGEILL